MGSLLDAIRRKMQNLFSAPSKPHPHERIDTLNKNVEQSFANLRRDMEHISKLLFHFRTKHDAHERQTHMLMKRIGYLEAKLQENVETRIEERKQELEEEEEKIISLESRQQATDMLWESLTETQQKLCWKLAALQKEMPDQWISLKYLAQELYPDKDYAIVRSTLSQFIAALEEMGLVKRKRKGKQAYVISTSKNPCLGKKRPVALSAFEKKQMMK